MPRAAEALVRLALSNDVLKTRPMFNRTAISFSACATSSAWARLSSWHGPAITEIGKALPKRTWPRATTGAAVDAVKAVSLRGDHDGRTGRDASRLGSSRPSEYQGCGDGVAGRTGMARQPARSPPRLFERRERRRRQQLAHDIADDLAVLLRLGARRHPFGIGHESRPYLLPLGERFPLQHVSEIVIGFADHGGEETGLADAVLFPQLERDGFEALDQ